MNLFFNLALSVIITIAALAVLSPFFNQVDSIFTTLNGSNSSTSTFNGMTYFLLYSIPTFMVITGLVFVLKPRIQQKLMGA